MPPAILTMLAVYRFPVTPVTYRVTYRVRLSYMYLYSFTCIGCVHLLANKYSVFATLFIDDIWRKYRRIIQSGLKTGPNLTTRDAAWCIISVVSVSLSVCQTVTCKKALTRHEVHFRKSGISLGNTGQLCMWWSSGKGQGHRSKKVENPYSRNVECRVGITPVL